MELWTKEHLMTLLPTLAVMLVASILFRRWLKEKPLKIRMIPFQILACIIVLLEIGKQLESLLSEEYSLYRLPFHFCSLFIFGLPLMAFYRGKHRRVVTEVVTALCASVTMLMLIYPNVIYSASNISHYFTEYISFHTVSFHCIVVFEFMLILALELWEPMGREGLRPVVKFMAAYCVIAIVMAHLLQTNFNNFYSCNVPPLEALRLQIQGTLGYWPTQCLYVVIVGIVNLLFVSLAHTLQRAAYRLFHREKHMAPA